MTKRITRLLAACAALAALALGGSAIAGAVQSGPDRAETTAEPAEPNGAAERGEAAESAEGPEASEAGQEKGEEATGPQADRAKQAALAATGGGTVTSVQQEEAEGSESEDPGEAGEEAGGERDHGFQSPAGSAWEVEVTQGSKRLEVYLDKDLKVLDTVPAEQE